MSFKTGDFLIYTEERIKKAISGVENAPTGIFSINSDIKKMFESLGERVYIFTEYSSYEGQFNAKINGDILKNLKIKDFRLATLKEKRRYDLTQIYKE